MLVVPIPVVAQWYTVLERSNLEVTLSNLTDVRSSFLYGFIMA
jgi:hypothetical protein